MTEKTQPSEKNRTLTDFANSLFPLFLIVVTGVLCYSSSFDASFHFDDFPSIVRNKNIRNLWDLETIWRASTTRFVAYFTFALNYHIHGLSAFGYHVLNLIIHLSAALSVYWLSRLAFATPQLKETPLASHGSNIALATSLLFVSHPIETQAVTYIVQRIASLAGLFCFLSTALYIRARIFLDQENPLHVLLYCGSIATALFAMFSKEISVTLPFCILVVEYFFFSPSLRKLHSKLFYLSFILLTLPVIPLTWITTRRAMVEHLGPAAETDAISRVDYLLTQFNVIRTYLKLLFFPTRQSLDYDFPVVDRFFDPATLASFLLLTALLASAFFLFRRFRLISFGIVWFFLTLSVESSFIPIKDVIFEHRVYLPSFGIFLSVTVTFFHLLGKRPRILFSFFSLVIPLLMLLTVNRNITWREQVLIWHDAAKTAPQKFRVIVNRGAGYSFLDKNEYAVKDYERAIALGRDDATPYLNVALHFLNNGDYESAVSEFGRALTVEPNSPNLYLNRGLAHMAYEKYDLAYEDFRTATSLDPANPSYMNALGTACDKLRQYHYAKLAFTRAIALDDSYAAPYLNRGKTLRSLSAFSGAIEDFNRAAELEPNTPEIFLNRGMVYIELSQYKMAIQDFTRAITMNPAYVEAYSNRGMAYLRLGIPERALVDLSRAAELNPALPKLYRNRAKVLQALGKNEEGKVDLEKAEDLEKREVK